LIDDLSTPEIKLDLHHFCAAHKFSYEDVVGVAKSETANDRLVMSDPITSDVRVLTHEGQEVLTAGTPEVKFWKLLPTDCTFISKASLILHFGGNEALVGVASGALMKQKCLSSKKEKGTDKDSDQIFFCRVKDKEVEDLAPLLSTLQTLTQDQVKNLTQRKWITTKKVTTFLVSRGPQFGKKAAYLLDLTQEHLTSGCWENTSFKPINFHALGKPTHGGYLHPLLKVRTAFRQIFLELGYEEMPTNKWVESSFWNFDSLFQPQQHPAREAHDTFFIKTPATTLDLPAEYVERVKQMHQHGGHDSIGWRYQFSDEEPRKNVLRTHTTAVSARMLYALAQEKPFKPTKYFSIDRVYRNETVDTTHLAEFQQIEGLIADYNISLVSLMGAIKQFYARIGITGLKFKPAYNPYTEPSMEIFGYHEGKKDWIEIGNSGVFRPEMLLPMGLPPGVGVAAWGLSLERPTMIMYGYQKITQLVGPKVELGKIYTNPIAQFSNQ